MIYPYCCPDCDHNFEVIKSVKAIDDPEHCPECSGLSMRYIAKSQFFYGEKDWDTAHYNPALGKVVKNNAEGRRIAKEMGMVEVGDEPVDKIHKKFDTERDHKISRTYDDICSDNLGEIRTK